MITPFSQVALYVLRNKTWLGKLSFNNIVVLSSDVASFPFVLASFPLLCANQSTTNFVLILQNCPHADTEAHLSSSRCATRPVSPFLHNASACASPQVAAARPRCAAPSAPGDRRAPRGSCSRSTSSPSTSLWSVSQSVTLQRNREVEAVKCFAHCSYVVVSPCSDCSDCLIARTPTCSTMAQLRVQIPAPSRLPTSSWMWAAPSSRRPFSSPTPTATPHQVRDV